LSFGGISLELTCETFLFFLSVGLSANDSNLRHLNHNV
jgi:hypothetical protein